MVDATYDLPLRHVTYGRMLGERIRARSGVEGDVLDFALEPEFTSTVPPEDKPEPLAVLFLARPDQRRRGFDLGVDALSRLHERRPDVEIRLFGSSDDELPALPFPVRNLGVLSAAELAAALNAAHVFLSFSLTNVSHAPYEAMACGCAVVEADMPQVRGMLPEGAAVFAALEPDAVATALERLVDDRERRVAVARRGIEATRAMSWDETARQFERVLRELAFVRLAPDGNLPDRIRRGVDP